MVCDRDAVIDESSRRQTYHNVLGSRRELFALVMGQLGRLIVAQKATTETQRGIAATK